jgi:folate-binding protein YgfZ
MKIYQPSISGSPIHWSWVSLTGSDAKDFLHRLTTSNLKSLNLGQGAPGCFLTPQGKIRATFQLWNYAQNEYAFEFDAGLSQKWKADLLALIDQLTFGEKITLTDVTGLDSRWFFFEPDELQSTLEKMGPARLSPGETVAIDEEIRICHQGNSQFGRPWITAWGRPARLNQWIETTLGNPETATFMEIDSWRIQAVRPRADYEILPEAVMPLEVGLKENIAENKGCYPGQEVIEKIIALGSPPRRLVRIDGTGPAPQLSDKIHSLSEPPAEVGQVTSITESENGFSALAIVKKIYAKEELKVRFSNPSQSEGVIMKIAPYA